MNGFLILKEHRVTRIMNEKISRIERVKKLPKTIPAIRKISMYKKGFIKYNIRF